MKKQYINPDMKVVEVKLCQQMLAGSLPLSSDEVDGGLSREDDELDLIDLLK